MLREGTSLSLPSSLHRPLILPSTGRLSRNLSFLFFLLLTPFFPASWTSRRVTPAAPFISPQFLSRRGKEGEWTKPASPGRELADRTHLLPTLIFLSSLSSILARDGGGAAVDCKRVTSRLEIMFQSERIGKPGEIKGGENVLLLAYLVSAPLFCCWFRFDSGV